MVDVRELRIGNWIWSDDVNMPYQLNDFGMVVVKRSFENRSPIPLTPDILVKCGFEIVEFKVHEYRLDIHRSWIMVVKNGEFNLHDAQDEFYSNYIPIKSLHQLQNLYYSLTGKELEIKL